MARADTLDILADIVDTLRPVGGATKGTPLRAADWNTVVAAVASLAQLVASREESAEDHLADRFAAADHEHTGAATLSWLEPQTRKLVEAAMSGSVEQRLGQDKIERDMAALRAEIAALRNDIQSIRIGIDGLRDSDFARERSLGRLGNDIEGLKTIETGLGNLTDRLNGMSGDIAAVLTFRDRLSDPTGQPIDVSGLATRVGSLENLRENLLTANGELVRIREVESAIARLQTGTIMRDEADRLVANRLRDANLLADAGLLDGINARVSETLAPRFDEAAARTEGLRADLAGLRSSVEPLSGRIEAMDTRVTDQTGRLDALAGVGARADGLSVRIGIVESGLRQTQESAAAIPALTESVGRLNERVETIDARSARIDANIAATARLAERMAAAEQSTAAMPALNQRMAVIEVETSRLSATTSRLATAEARLDGLETRTKTNEAQLDTLGDVPSRLATLDRSNDDMRSWRNATESRLGQISAGGAANDRIAALEERVADQGVTIRKQSDSIEQLRGTATRVDSLDSRMTTVERGATVRGSGVLVRPGGGFG